MYQIIKDSTLGTIKIFDSWSISATGASAAPVFSNIDQELSFNFNSLTSVESFKSFTFSTTGHNPNAYLTQQYRVSRDYNNWTQWLDLTPVISDFPPFTSTDTMYIEIKFKRSGTSDIGDIKLLSYELGGVVRRNVVDGESTIVLSPTNKTVVIKPPYIFKVFKINDIEIISRGNIGNVSIKYRYSQDYGRTVTPWIPFTKENITSERITPIRFFQIEYLLELQNDIDTVKIYDINIIGDFQNVTEDYSKTNLYGIRENCNCIKLGIVGDSASNMSTEVGGQPTMLTSQEPSALPQLSSDDKNALFKPYQLDAATNLLNKISNDSIEIFGHEVVYFLTDPDKNGIDYTFHEYTLYNYVCDDLIKVAVDNNSFPDNTGAINQFDLSLFESFEIHITKETFKKAFGPEKRPSKEDFLWFCQINKMFTVEHSQPFRNFNNNAIYYKVMLKKYNGRANVNAINQTLADKVSALTNNSTIDQIFGLENGLDKKAVANKEQFTPLTLDSLRLEVLVDTNREDIVNSEVIISKTNYDLSGITFGRTAVKYRNMQNWFKASDNFSFMCWFSINNYTVNDSYSFFTYYDTVNSLGIDFTLSADTITTTINSSTYSLNLGTNNNLADGIEEDTWYAFMVNVDQKQRNIKQYLYKRNVDDEDDAKYVSNTNLRLLYESSEDIIPTDFWLDIDAIVKASDMKITNLRLFNDVIPSNIHSKILNQMFITNDSKYLIFADNANMQLYLPNYTFGQIDKGSPGYVKP